MNEYKGIYYNDDKEQEFYEGGAHFRYYDLYRCLEKLLVPIQRQRQNSTQKVTSFHVMHVF